MYLTVTYKTTKTAKRLLLSWRLTILSSLIKSFPKRDCMRSRLKKKTVQQQKNMSVWLNTIPFINKLEVEITSNTDRQRSLFSLPIYRHPFFNSPRRGVPPHRNRTHHSGPDTETVRSTKQSFLVMPLLTCNNPPYFEPFRYSCTSSPYLRLHRAHIPPPHMGPVVLLLHPMHH